MKDPVMTKRKLYMLAAVASLLIAILWMPQPERQSLLDGDRPRITPAAASSVVTNKASAEPRATTAPPVKEQTRNAQLIDRIAIDKPEVCPDEDFRIEAFEAPSEEEVSFIIGDQRGAVAVRRERVAGHWTVPVVASRGHAEIEYGEIAVDVLSADDPRCSELATARLDLEYSPYRDALIFATVGETRGLTPPLSYTWDFGDGTTAEGHESTVQHSYADRAQDRLTSSFVVIVKVMDNQGQVATTRGSVYFPNLYHEARMVSGNRVLRAVTDALAGTPDRGVHTSIAIDNIEADPVEWSKASLSFEPCDGLDEPSAQQVTPARLLSSTYLPPGETTEVQLQLSPEQIPADTCRVTVELAGDTVPPRSGQPVSEPGPSYTDVNTQVTYVLQSFPVHEGGHPLGRTSEPVTNAHELTRLAKAMRLLGKQRIAVSELEALERSGRL